MRVNDEGKRVFTWTRPAALVEVQRAEMRGKYFSTALRVFAFGMGGVLILHLLLEKLMPEHPLGTWPGLAVGAVVALHPAALVAQALARTPAAGRCELTGRGIQFPRLRVFWSRFIGMDVVPHRQCGEAQTLVLYRRGNRAITLDLPRDEEAGRLIAAVQEHVPVLNEGRRWELRDDLGEPGGPWMLATLVVTLLLGACVGLLTASHGEWWREGREVPIKCARELVVLVALIAGPATWGLALRYGRRMVRRGDLWGIAMMINVSGLFVMGAVVAVVTTLRWVGG